MTPPLTYLDQAATGYPKPRETIDEMRFYQQYIGGNPGRGGHSAAREAAKLVYDCRQALAALFGGESERIFFTLNTTYALNMILKSTLQKGDRVLLSDLEHNALLRPALALREKGVAVDFFETDLLDPARTVRNAAAAIRADTKMLACTAASNVLPVRLPLRELGKLCGESGVFFTVDGAQGGGHFPISVKDCAIDALCLPGHKGLFGVTGCGVGILSPRLAAFLTERPTCVEGGSGSQSLLSDMPKEFPDRLEAGTLPVLPIAGLLGGLRFLEKAGKKIESKEKRLYRGFREILLREKKVKLYLPEAETGSLLLFEIRDIDPSAAASAFDEYGVCLRDGLHCAPLAHRKIGTVEKGALRLSFGATQDENDVDRFAAVLRRICRNCA